MLLQSETPLSLRI